MRTEALTASMKNSISEVLEKMFFLPLDLYDAANPQEVKSFDAEKTLTSRLTFTGPFSGHFVFWAPKDLALSLTADFLGKDRSSVSEKQLTETVKEIVNIVAGNTFSHYDSQVIFDLSIPEIIAFEDARIDPSVTGEAVFVLISTLSDRLALQLVVES